MPENNKCDFCGKDEETVICQVVIYYGDGYQTVKYFYLCKECQNNRVITIEDLITT